MGGRRIAMSVGVCIAVLVVATTPVVSAAPSGGALPPVLIQSVQIGGERGVPADAAMVALNVTAVAPAEPGFLTVFPCDQAVPLASNVNYLADDVAPNMVLSRLAADGTVCIATHAVTDVLVDLIGYVPAGSPITPIANPVRALDTRTQTTFGSPVPGGSSFSYQFGGQYGVAAGADTVLLNLTAIAGASPGFVTAWPCDAAQPGTSTVNYGAFEISPNFVITRMAADGSVCFFSSAPADLVIDVAGSAAGGFTTLSRPVRIHDSRLAGGIRPAGSTLSLAVTARDDVPDDATGAIYNLTSVDSTAPGFATSHPCDVAAPVVSNLNYAPGGAVANTTVTRLSASGELCVYNLTPTNLIVDLIGFVRGVAQYVPVTPIRILDTRDGWQRSCPWVIALTWISFSEANITVTNVVSGAGFTQPPISIDPGRVNDPFVDADCTGYWYVGGTSPGQLVFVAFPGAAPKPSLPNAGTLPIGGYRGYGQLSDGTIVAVDRNANVVRVADGVVLADLPVNEFVYNSSVSADGIVAIRLGAIQTNTITDRAHIELWDIADVHRISDITVDRDTVSMELSRSATYLTLDRYNGAQSTASVVTISGDLVDAVTTSGTGIVRSHFWGEGSLLVCAEGIGLFHWDLFSEPALIANSLDPRFFGAQIPGSNSIRCDRAWA